MKSRDPKIGKRRLVTLGRDELLERLAVWLEAIQAVPDAPNPNRSVTRYEHVADSRRTDRAGTIGIRREVRRSTGRNVEANESVGASADPERLWPVKRQSRDVIARKPVRLVPYLERVGLDDVSSQTSAPGSDPEPAFRIDRHRSDVVVWKARRVFRIVRVASDLIPVETREPVRRRDPDKPDPILSDRVDRFIGKSIVHAQMLEAKHPLAMDRQSRRCEQQQKEHDRSSRRETTPDVRAICHDVPRLGEAYTARPADEQLYGMCLCSSGSVVSTALRKTL